MTDHTTEFFERLGKATQPALSQIDGTIRLDVDDRSTTKHWYLEVSKGKVAVSQRNVKADVTLRLSRSLLDRVVTGEANATAAALRGQLGFEGDPQMLVAFQRLLPGPPRGNTANLPTKGRTR
jgi:ubiquinone biosynthesis protein UbiJ